MIYGKPPAIPPNDTLPTARNLGTVVHLVEPTPDHRARPRGCLLHPDRPYRDGPRLRRRDHRLLGLLPGHRRGRAWRWKSATWPAMCSALASGSASRSARDSAHAPCLRRFRVRTAPAARGPTRWTSTSCPRSSRSKSQTLLPGQGGQPGGATASLVVTLQGDRLDPATAENPANYAVTWLGPDGTVGTADDQVIPLATGFQSVVYDPSANLDVASGKIHPTAVRQTVTLLFGQPAPRGLVPGHTLAGHPGSVVHGGRTELAVRRNRVRRASCRERE